MSSLRADVPEVVGEMLRLKLRRVRLFDGVEYELHDSAFAAPPAPAAEQPEKVAVEENEQCPCGHSLAIEHNEAGCYHGCTEEQCSVNPDRVQAQP